MNRLKLIDEVPNDIKELYDFEQESPIDANSMENEDFNNLEEIPVLNEKGDEIGVISQIKQKKKQWLK